jgi:hypothetical protein
MVQAADEELAGCRSLRINQDFDITAVSGFVGLTKANRLDPGVLQLEVFYQIIADHH